MPGAIESASTPWPPVRDIPPAGAHLVTTTWRDILDAAETVGRDPTPWSAAMPELARAELIARWSPLMAYLRRRRNAWPQPGSSGHLIEPNAIYRHGTEQTARGAFGYRLGMTMAEWACPGLMGLGPALHAEASTPAGAGSGWSPSIGLPDLVGDHWHPPTTWLVEAKGARRTGRTGYCCVSYVSCYLPRSLTLGADINDFTKGPICSNSRSLSPNTCLSQPASVACLLASAGTCPAFTANKVRSAAYTVIVILKGSPESSKAIREAASTGIRPSSPTPKYAASPLTGARTAIVSR